MDYACILSESQLSDDDKYLKLDCEKVFRSGSWIFSSSGWNRPSDVLAHQMKWPEPPRTVVKDQSKFTAWIVRSLVPVISLCLQKNNCLDLDKNTATVDAEFLIASHGKIFLIDSGFGVTAINDYFVSGSGGKIALGSISGFKQLLPDRWDKEHEEFSRVAIGQAVKWDFYSSGDIKGYRSYPNGKVEEAIGL
jgi:hypothetical protein